MNLQDAVLYIFVIVFMLVVIILVYANRYKRVPPDRAMVVYGKEKIREVRGQKKKIGFQIVKGGGKFIIPIIEGVEYLPLEIRTLDITVKSVVTQEGVMLNVEAVAQTKIASDIDSLYTAAEQLLHKTNEEIDYVLIKSLEGHVRGVCANLTVEQINADRNKVSQEIQSVAVTDLKTMGLNVRSFTIRDLSDEVGYLEAMGKKRTAEVKRDAVIGEAEAKRDAKIESAEADKLGETARAIADTEIAKAFRDKKLKIAEYEEEVNKKEADRDIAYELQTTTRDQELIQAKMEVKLREKEKEIELSDKEIERKEKELEATVRKPARAEADRNAFIADGKAKAHRAEGQAEADVVKMKGRSDADVVVMDGESEAKAFEAKGNAQAEVTRTQGFADAEALQAKGLAEGKAIEAKGLAEATAMDNKAEAWRKYGEAAIAQIIIDKLPEIAEELSRPLENTQKLIIMGGDSGPSKLVREGTNSMVQLSNLVKTLTGMDLVEMVKEGYAGITKTTKDAVKTVKKGKK